MNFFNLKKQSDKKDEYLFSLVLRQDDGIGLLMRTNPLSHSVEIIEKRLFRFSNSWENIVYDIDELLFAIENEHTIKIKKVVYFVYGHLVDQHTKEIKEIYAQYLKNISKENSLEPVGYFEYNELIPAYIQFKENAKLNLMLIEVDSPAVSLFINQSGKIVFAESAAKTEEFTKDVEALLKKAKESFVLPTRIIMYDSSKLEEESDALLTHKWNEKLFMQIPRIEVLSEDDISAALRFGVEKQLFKSPSSITGNGMSGRVVEKEEEEHVPDAQPIPTSQGIAGFVVGEDIRENQENQEPPLEAVLEAEHVENPMMHDASSSPVLAQGSFKDRFSGIKLPNFSGMNGSGNLLVPGILISSILLIIGLIFATLFFFHKATLTLMYQPDVLSKKIEIDNLAIKKQTQTFSETDSIKTTGTKEVGEKAKGQVTIYNALEEEQTISAGTEFITEDGDIFVIDKALSVKPATQTITSEGDILTTTSKTDTELTAQEIGPEGNVKKDIEFTVDGRSKKDIFAKAKAAFTGGTKEDIQAVSAADYENINDSINIKLDKKAADTEKTKGNISVISDLTAIDIDEEKYSHEIDEEADTLDLSVEAKVTYFTFSEDDMKKLLIAEFSKDLDANETFDPKNVNYKITEAEASEESKDIVLTVDAEAKSSFDGDDAKIAQAIKGKGTNDLKKILQGNFKAAGYTMSVDSPLPFLNSMVPFFVKNIQITYKAI